MSNPTVENILKNIYGVSATGSLANMSGGGLNRHLSISGGHVVASNSSDYSQVQRPQPNIKFLDETKANINNMSGGYNSIVNNKQKRKGRSKKQQAVAKEDIVIYASPEYIKHPDLKEFIDKFFLYYRFSRSPNGAIYILPSTAKIAEMVAKRPSAPEGSVELQKKVRESDKIGYERYLFVTFGNNSKNDKYRIDPDTNNIGAYPNSSFGTIRRTNIKGEVFYITCKDNMEVKIHQKPDDVNAGLPLKFIARFNNGGYVFQGDIPAKSLEVIPPKKVTARKYAKLCAKLAKTDINSLSFGEMLESRGKTMTGGASNSSMELLNMYNRFYNNDYDLAAEHFLKAVDKKGKLANKYQQNGDLVYDAVYYALENPSQMKQEDFGKESKQIMTNFKPQIRGNEFKNAVRTVKDKLNKILKQCKKSGNYTKFIKSYKNIYATKDEAKIKADIMSSYIRYNNVDLLEANKAISDIFNNDNPTLQYCNVIKNSFEAAPLPSAFGTEYYPLMNNEEITFDSIMKQKGGVKEEGAEERDLVREIYNKQIKGGKRKKSSAKETEINVDNIGDGEDDDLDFGNNNNSDIDSDDSEIEEQEEDEAKISHEIKPKDIKAEDAYIEVNDIAELY